MNRHPFYAAYTLATYAVTPTLLLITLTALTASQSVAQNVTLVTNTTDWRESTFVETSNANDVPWLGVSSLPDVSTFTLTPTEEAAHPSAIPGATTLAGGSSVHFFRAVFTLTYSQAVTADVRASFDNDLNVFINGRELALDGDFAGENFAGVNHRLFVNEDGSIINGYQGGQEFTGRVASIFPSSFFNVGTNEVILALRNLNGGDGGGVTFRADFNAAPAPGSLAVGLIGIVPAVGLLLRRRRKL